MSLPATRAYVSVSTKAITNSSKCLYNSSSRITRPQIASRQLATSLRSQTRTYIFPQTQFIQRHTFSTSAALSKKKDKNKRNDDVESSSSSSSSGSASSADPFDFSQLHNGVSDALARLKDDLQKLRSGGRLNPEVIEQLRVNLVKGSNETVRLGEVAQVVPKGGRAITIIVGEEDVSLFFLFLTISSF